MRPRRGNVFWIVGPVAVIDISTRRHPLATTLIDGVDLPVVLDGAGRWSARQPVGARSIYAARATACGSSETMHRRVRPFSREELCDHINTDGLDNRKRNLRAASRMQNARNRRDHAGPSRFKGVHWHKAASKWCAQICVNYKRMVIGRYDDETEAAHAYDAAARKYFGEFARLNFPE